MSGSKKKTPAEELIESLLKDVGGEMSDFDHDQEIGSLELESTNIEGIVQQDDDDQPGFLLSTDNIEYGSEIENEFESTRNVSSDDDPGDLKLSFDEDAANLPAAMGALEHKILKKTALPTRQAIW